MKNKDALDNRARQLDPGQSVYHRDRGETPARADELAAQHRANQSNHGDQLNPQADAYSISRAAGAATKKPRSISG